MSAPPAKHDSRGRLLAERLGLKMPGREGHDLTGPCLECQSSDAFRVHEETGVAQCYSCGARWSPYRLAKTVVGRETAKDLLVELGIFEPRAGNGRQPASVDPLEAVASQKGVSAESFKALGAKVVDGAVVVPMYGPDGEQCSSMTLRPNGGKGVYAKGKPVGLFLPHNEHGEPILPKPGEIWHEVEGVKDAAALHSLGFHTFGLPGSFMNAKFARLFPGVNVVLVPDRDRAGVEGARKTAGVLFGVAESVRTTALPAEFTESGGADVRDVLKMKNGEALLRQAIADAQPIDLASPASKAAEKPAKSPGVVKILSDMICDDNDFARVAGGKLYRFAGGVYKSKAETYVKMRVKQLCVTHDMTRNWSTRLAEEVVEFIRVDAPELWQRPPLDVLNVENGLLTIANRELLPHSPAHLSPVQLPVEYDPAATCPAIERFVGEVFPRDAHDLAWELVAWLMRADTGIQKAILLIGEGANGKSVFLRLVIRLIGKANTSSVSLHKLEENRFSAARLIGKLANICPDLPSKHLAGTSVFKACTGDDYMDGEIKFKGSFDFKPYARLVFSANYPPRSEDASHAFFRRWHVIPFDRTFEPEKQIDSRILDARLQSPSELSGLLNRALEALPRLAENGLSEPASVKRAWSEFRGMTDPLAVWLDHYTTADPDAMVAQSTLRAGYGAECEKRGRPCKSATAFGRDLRRHRPSVEKSRRTVNSKQTWCYVGIGLIQETNRVVEVVEVATVSPILLRTREGSQYEGGESEGSREEKQRGENRGNLDYLAQTETTRQRGNGKPAEVSGCSVCGSSQHVDVTLSGGRVRRDCAECGHFLSFPVWTPSQEESPRGCT